MAACAAKAQTNAAPDAARRTIAPTRLSNIISIASSLSARAHALAGSRRCAPPNLPVSPKANAIWPISGIGQLLAPELVGVNPVAVLLRQRAPHGNKWRVKN